MAKLWTKEETYFLRKYYKKKGAIYCYEHLDRELSAIRRKAQKIDVVKRKNKEIYDKENIERVVKSSKNLSEALRNMGLRDAGGNYNVIKNYIKKYNISTSHFETASDRMKRLNGNRLTPLEDILVENSTYTSSTHLKERLYREGLKKRECEKCGQDEIWNGNHMSLILDHINGTHTDNRIENLQIVCPNCNATLETHCNSKNIE